MGLTQRGKGRERGDRAGGRGGGKRGCFGLVVLPAEAGRADGDAAVKERAATKEGKTCEKFRQMKTHSEVSVPLPPSRPIVGHVHCVQAQGAGGGGSTGGMNEVVKESH